MLNILNFEMLIPILHKHLSQKKHAHYGIALSLASYPKHISDALFDYIRGQKEFAKDNLFCLRAEQEHLIIDHLKFSQNKETEKDFLREKIKFTDLVEFLESIPKHAILFIDSLESLNLQNQMRVIGIFRGVREKFDNGLQTVFCGIWQPKSFLEEWKKLKPGESSPVDSHKIYYLDGYTLSDIENRLHSNINQLSHALKKPFLEFVLSYTGGDTRLVDYIVENISSVKQKNIEKFIFDLPDEGTVVDFFMNDAIGLTQSAKMKLEAALRYQIVILNKDDCDAENLWLKGFFSPTDRASNPSQTSWRVKSPLLADVLRGFWNRITKNTISFCANHEIMPLQHTPAIWAYPLVYEIESFLRNLIVTVLSDKKACTHPLQDIPFFSGPDVFDLISKRRDEDMENPYVSYPKMPLSSFLDVSHIESIITHQELYNKYFNKFFPNKNDFIVNFGKFNALRKAIAHNKSISILAIEDLHQLLNYFENRVGNVSADAVEDISHLGFLSVNQDSILLIKTKKNEFKIKLTVKNESEFIFYQLTLKATFVNTGCEAAMLSIEKNDFRINPKTTANFLLDGKAESYIYEKLPIPKVEIIYAKIAR